MKTYLFGLCNWKNGTPARIIRKRFSSAYAADRWAMRIFTARNSPYNVWLIPGAEEE